MYQKSVPAQLRYK